MGCLFFFFPVALYVDLLWFVDSSLLLQANNERSHMIGPGDEKALGSVSLQSDAKFSQVQC